MKIFILGTGNVAWHVGEILNRQNYPILGLYGRDVEETKRLSVLWKTEAFNEWNRIPENADVYIFCLRDNSYSEIISKFPHKDKCMIHTSGIMDLSLFEELSPHRGILYPFQSLTKYCNVQSKKIPFCLESSDRETENKIVELAEILGSKYQFMNSEQRKFLHIAGVLANNFSNALYSMAFQILKEAKIETEILKPLILETALKVQNNKPEFMQTGPAARGDCKTIEMQSKILKEIDPAWSRVYDLLSKIILKLR